jgi:hypothetical protein
MRSSAARSGARCSRSSASARRFAAAVALWAVTRVDPPASPGAGRRAAVGSRAGERLRTSAPSLTFTDVGAAAGVDFDRFDGARGARGCCPRRWAAA